MPRTSRSDREAASNMPALDGLIRTTRMDRLLNIAMGRGNYPTPITFQISVAARLLDKRCESGITLATRLLSTLKRSGNLAGFSKESAFSRTSS